MQLLASPHIKQVNWSVGCTVSSNMRAHISICAKGHSRSRRSGFKCEFLVLLWHLKRGFATVLMEVREKVDVWWLLLHAPSHMNSTVLLMDVYFFLWAVWTSHTQNPLASKCDLICLTAPADSKHHPTATLTLQSILCCYMYPYLV